MLTIDTQDCAILSEHGPAGRHARDTLSAKLRSMGRRGPLAIADRSDGMVCVVLNLDTLKHSVLS